ncbi:MAG TPA: NUDIX hydrolase [Dehalococcoidia bacterium]|nr:NUDIX hydrolase [Dehalococcoidia bacterium]
MRSARPSESGLYRLSTAVFAQREGKILLLKRAAGDSVGAWYLPGGAVDPGETVEEGARRELLEEAGLAPVGPLTCVGVAHMHVYGYDSLQVFYACDCPDGEVTVSHEHSGARWMEPSEYRARYFSDEILARVVEADAGTGWMLSNIRSAIDGYLAWLARGAGRQA